MNYWHQITMVRLTVSFIMGIVIALLVNANLPIPAFITISLFLIYSLFVFWSKLLSSYKYRWIHGLIISISLILMGYEWCIQNTSKYNKNHIGNFISDSSCVIIGTLTEPINERENSYRATLKVSAIQQNDQWKKANGNILIYMAKDSVAATIQYGDEVLINTKVSEVKGPQNPEEFDYKNYLANKSVYHQAYLNSENIKVLAHDQGNPFIKYALYLQGKLLRVLKDNQIEGNEYAVVSAMLLGNRDKIDADLINAYSGSGAVHILSVSGLHVGLIIVLLNYLLIFMDKSKVGKIFKVFILLGFIWFYAAITGFSPAVLRSTAMFSFIFIGKSFNRKVNGFNTLATSLFFLLIIDPWLITDVGFQLSYLSVVGIMGIYPGIYRLWSPHNWLMDKTWGLISVSLAAQIITAPLAMYYFHQFPNLFLLTNLIIIPLTTIIIYTGMAFYALSFIPLISVWVSKVLVFLVYLLNETVRIIEHLPYAVSRGIHISNTMMLLMFVATILFTSYFYTKQKKLLFLGLFVILFISLFNIIDRSKVLNNRKFIVYSVNHHAVYDFIDGSANYLLSDSNLLNDKKKINFHIQNNWCAMGVAQNNLIAFTDSNQVAPSENRFSPIFIRNNFIQFYDKRIAVINKENCERCSPEKLKIDYLILSDNAKVNIRDLLKQFSFRKIIIDSSNAIWRTNKWLEECKEMNVEVFAVNYSGAFEVNI